MLVDPELLRLCDPRFVRGGDFTGILFALGNPSVSGLLGGGPSGGGSGRGGPSSKIKPSALLFGSINGSSSLSRVLIGFPNESKLCVIFSSGSSDTVGKPECDC